MGLLTLLRRAATDVPVPATGKSTLYIDDSDGIPAVKNATGAVQKLGGQPPGTSVVADQTTGKLEQAIPYTALVTGASKAYTKADRGKAFPRSNGGAAMSDTLPTDLTAADNGWWVKVDNVDTVAGADLTMNAGAGTFVTTGNPTAVQVQGTRQTYVWTGSGWRFDAGNGNLLRISPSGTATPVVSGNIPKFSGTSGRIVTDSGVSVANMVRGFANVLDYGADPTGTVSSEAAITAAVTALGAAGGVLFFPTGSYLTTSQPYVISANQIIVRGAGPGQTFLRTNNTTGDQLRVTGYGSRVEDMNIGGPGVGTTSSKTSGLGLDMQSTEGRVTNVEFDYQFDCLGIQGSLADARSCTCRYFKDSGIIVNHQSDHRISDTLMVNATSPTGAGIDVRVTASLVLEQLNLINCNYVLNISPASGVTIPSVKATDCFFDSSVVALNMTGLGFVMRSEFTNCWFSTQSIAGIRMNPQTAGGVNGVTFVNCDIYNNLAGTTTGVDTNANVGKWKMVGCSIAGWTTGMNLVAGAAHFPTVLSNTIGAVSAFGNNTTGIAIGAGTFKGLVLQGNDVVDNGTAATFGALTITATTASSHRIVDNAGINPHGVVTAPAASPVSATTYTNTTGFRVLVMFKTGATTAPTALVVNGVSSVLPGVSTLHPIPLDPGGTISYTSTVAATWTWIGQ